MDNTNYRKILDDILCTQSEDQIEVIVIRLRKRGLNDTADYVEKLTTGNPS